MMIRQTHRPQAACPQLRVAGNELAKLQNSVNMYQQQSFAGFPKLLQFHFK